MRLLSSLIAFVVSSVLAFEGTSPIVLFSSSPAPTSFGDASHAQLQSRGSVLESARSFLAGCQSEIYYIITQPELSASELSYSSPHLEKATTNPSVMSRFSVAEAVGMRISDADGLLRYVEEVCGARRAHGFAFHEALQEREPGGSVIVRATYDMLPSVSDERRDQLLNMDASFYNQVLKELPTGYKYTIVYTSSPASYNSTEGPMLYEAAFDEPLHMDLRRDIQDRDHTYPKGEDVRPLFEKYQFLSPGLFMTIFVSLILIGILSVGISAVAGLEVSYGAFAKETGSVAQKK